MIMEFYADLKAIYYVLTTMIYSCKATIDFIYCIFITKRARALAFPQVYYDKSDHKMRVKDNSRECPPRPYHRGRGICAPKSTYNFRLSMG